MAYTPPATGRPEAPTGAAEQAKEKVQEGAEQAKSTVRGQVEQRSTDAGAKLKTQAGDVRTVAEELRKQGKDAPAKVAEQAAERVERVGGYLQESDADRILSDVERYARQNPWVVMAGGLAAGFLASRFLKASSSDRYQGASRPQVPASGNGHSAGQIGRYGSGAPASPQIPAAPPAPPTTGGGTF
jgi:hypothetical protein